MKYRFSFVVEVDPKEMTETDQRDIAIALQDRLIGSLLLVDGVLTVTPGPTALLEVVSVGGKRGEEESGG